MTLPVANFDRVARPYRWLEYLSFGPCLERCRTANLDQLSQVSHALVMGDGDGRFLAKLLAVQPGLTADVVDASQSMLRLLDRRVRRSGPQAGERVCLYHADALAWTPARPFDLVVTHFFLDCFFPQQLETLVERLVPYAVPGTRWLISEFAIPRNPLLAWFARAIIGLLYRIFGLLTGLRVRTLPDHRAVLGRFGFVLIAEKHSLAGLLCSQVWLLPKHRSER